MTLETGTRLGPYEIEAAVGAGGMGVVYRARDIRLDRTVALKVLAPEVATNERFRRRFEREARAISGLSHQHICQLHDVGREGNVDYLVMEYLEGQSLAHRLAKGPLPSAELLRYATEIASALHCAHRKGIVHRDLKPGNVMLTAEGAKLLDFGLAKTGLLTGAESEDLTASPTASEPLTDEGTILGTCQYMAPEQLEGREADPRTDIFAFGAVLYEMATGNRAFEGSSQAAVIGAIMREQPPPASEVQSLTPSALDRVIQTCLTKDPEDRWQNAHDVELELQWIAEGGSAAGLPATVAARRRTRERLLWGAVAAAIIATVLLGLGHLFQRSDVLDVTTFQIPPPDSGNLGPARISPNGRYIVFVYSGLVWIRPLDNLEARPLSGTEGIQFRPFWSPDSRYIGFFADGKLQKIAVGGGPAETICEVPFVGDGTWGSTGEILWDSAGGTSIMRVAATGGEPTPEVNRGEDHGELWAGWPEFLPDGRHFVYLCAMESGETRLMVRALGSSEVQYLTTVDSRVQYAEPGFLLHARSNTVIAQPFDADHLKLIGEPISLGYQAQNILWNACFSASKDGTLIYQSSLERLGDLVWRDRSGRALGRLGEPARYINGMSFSPDEDRVAVVIRDANGNSDIWIVDVADGTKSRFTFDPAFDSYPRWSPDGTVIVFSSDRAGRRDEWPNLYRKHATGGQPAERILVTGPIARPFGWSRDGSLLIYQLNAERQEIWALPMDSVEEPFPVVQSPSNNAFPVLSPDSRWMAYTSDESGRYEVYVSRFPTTGGKWQISLDGAGIPSWSTDGTEIFYQNLSGELVSVPVETGETLVTGKPRVLFTTDAIAGLITRDGKRFLVCEPISGTEAQGITVVQNWHAALGR